MNWFKLVSALIGIGSAIADNFVKNEDSKKQKAVVVSVVSAIVEGLANHNPDGTPASVAYTGPAAKIEDVIK